MNIAKRKKKNYKDGADSMRHLCFTVKGLGHFCRWQRIARVGINKSNSKRNLDKQNNLVDMLNANIIQIRGKTLFRSRITTRI